MSAVNSSKNSIFCPPALGKPNPAENKPLDGPDTRTRILQKGQKGPNCFTRVLDLIRDREKAPNTTNTPKRQFEILVSNRKKSIVEADAIPDIAYHSLKPTTHLNPVIVSFLQNCTKANLETEQAKRHITTLDNVANVKTKLVTILPKFVLQNRYSNLFDFLQYLPMNVSEKRVEINREFMDRVKVNPNDYLESFRKTFSSFLKQISVDEYIQQHQIALVDAIAHQIIAERYGFKTISWKPQDSHTILMDELKANGPILLTGYFGSGFYVDPPIALKKSIQGRVVFGWPAGSPRKSLPEGFSSHAILVIGAEKIPATGTAQAQELVYFIDPSDDSDPNAPEKQRIFAMSYGKLTDQNSIRHIFGFNYISITGLKINTPFPYGYYYPKQTKALKSSPLTGSSSSTKIDD